MLLALGFQQSGLEIGDAWTIDRSYRFIDELSKLDKTTLEVTDYRVEDVARNGVLISASHRKAAATAAGGDDSVAKLRFGTGGAATYQEETTDPIRTRVDRVQWTAAEDRHGVSWSRTFKAAIGVPAGKVTIRPLRGTGTESTVTASYAEDGDDVHGEATATISLPKRIVTSLKMTFRNLVVPELAKSVRVVVNQSLEKP